LDDGPARAITQALGLPMTGLLGLLVRAAALNLIDFVTVPERLHSIGFRISEALIHQARISLAKSKRPSSDS
jgi:predicted nucleic acid-binding protein